MAALTIGWEYLTGYAVATDPSSRDRAEWPPHPARVFMALAAAWFETGEDSDEGKALRWLEALGEPEIVLPRFKDVHERTKVTVYVPVNDKADAHSQPNKKKKAKIYPHLGSVQIGRNRQPRTFPRRYVGNAPVFMHWTRADGFDKHRDALARICAKVTRIGHSSSLVQMWAEEDDPKALGEAEHLVVDKGMPETHVRIFSAGMLDMLKEQSGIVVRPQIRPTVGLWSGYRRIASPAHTDATEFNTVFDPDIVVLRHVGGPRLPVASTLAVTRVLRKTIMSMSGVQPVPAWVSGHEQNSQPHSGSEGHMACIPLPHVGGQHPDGHLLGIGLVFPRSVDRRERGEVLGKLLVKPSGEPNTVDLKLGSLGVWRVEKCDWTETRRALKPESWTAYFDRQQGAKIWASVTPIVLDKFPKSNRTKNRSLWTQEVEDIIKKSCERIGLPAPKYIDIDTTCWHHGSPRALGKRRPLRGHGALNTDAALGDGFPLFPSRGTNAPRPQVHVWLEFDECVVGPVLLGVGRYMGYGLCKPLVEDSQ